MKKTGARLNGNSIRAVIFDFGEVLSHAPAEQTIASMAALFSVSPDRFRKLYNSERHDYDCGTISPEQYWLAIARDAGVELRAEEIEWLRHCDVKMWSNLNPQMLRWARELKTAGLRTAVLSNMHADMALAVRSNRVWMADFDCLVLSAELGMVKPDPAIFHRALECLKVQANEALFIDDRERNTRGAEAMGIAGICANSTQAIRQQLEATGWDAPLPE